MPLYAEQNELDVWSSKALLANTAWFRPRKELWEEFAKILSTKNKSGLDGMIEIDYALFNSIKSFLLCRNDQLDDNKSLAFSTACEEIQAMIARAITVDQEIEAPQSNSPDVARRRKAEM